MVKVLDYVVTDEDAAALRSCPPDIRCVMAAGWWWCGRVLPEMGDHHGPFLTASEAVQVAENEDRRTRAEVGR